MSAARPAGLASLLTGRASPARKVEPIVCAA